MAYGNGAGILSALEALQEAGVSTTTYQNVQEWSQIQNLLRNSGYIEVVNDAGISRGWIKSFTDVVGQTATKTSSTLPSVINNAGGVYDLAASEYVITDAGVASAGGTLGEAFTALVTSPKAAVIASVLAAIGFAAGFDIGQDLVDKIFFNDETFDWKTDSIGGKIMTWIDKEGNAYISADLIERIKNVLIDNGLLDDAVEGHTGNMQADTHLTTCSLQGLADKLLEYTRLVIPTQLMTLWEPGLDKLREIIDDGSIFSGLYNGLGQVSFGLFETGLYRITVKSTNTNTLRDDATITNVFPMPGDDDSIITSSSDYISREINGNPLLPIPEYVEHQATSSVSIEQWVNIISGFTPTLTIGMPNIGTLNDVVIPRQPGATLPTEGNTIAQDYPTWWNNRKKVYTPEEGDPNKWTDLLHVRIPRPDDDVQNQDDTQTQPETEEQLDEQAKTQDDIATDNGISDTPPTDDIGDTPAIVPPTSGSDTGLVHIYNPTLNQLATFSQWLWSNNIFDNFSKLFQDPMQAIIGLNLLYATPSNGANANIIVGNLDSNCISKTIDEQYIDIDCGTVTVSKYFNNVLDYIDTKIELYLPFVGIVPLSAAEIVGKTVNVKCTVDVLTGTCLYQIYVGSQLLYTFTGNCAIQLPLSSANYSSVITGMIGLIGGGVATAVSGGALAPLAIGGAANMVGNLKHGVERSGNIGANAGAMGVKVPYLIITRHKPYNPTAYNKYYGYPSNTTVKLNKCNGFTRIKDIRLHDIYTYDEDAKVVATDDEMSMIETQLKEGVII